MILEGKQNQIMFFRYFIYNKFHCTLYIVFQENLPKHIKL